MTSIRVAAALVATLLTGTAATAVAQSGAPTTPTPPVVTQVQVPKPPPSAPPPPRAAPLAPAARRTSTPAPLPPTPVSGPKPTASRPDTALAAAIRLRPPTQGGDRTRPIPRNPKFASSATISRNMVPANAAPPAGTTMRCKDGSYLSGAPSADRCSGNGGVAAVFPAPRTLPAATKAQQKQP